MMGPYITEIRRKRGLSLTEVAERAGISKSYLSNIERNINRNPSIQVIKKISSVLDINLETLILPEAYRDKIELPDQELIDLANQLKDSGIEKEQLQEYKTLIEFLKWKNQESSK